MIISEFHAIFLLVLDSISIRRGYHAETMTSTYALLLDSVCK
jgi:hypothetical protein